MMKKEKSHIPVGTIASWLDQIEGPYELTNRDAWFALWQLGPENSDAIPLLVARMRDPQSTIRDHSARFLGQIGKAAQSAIPELLDSIRNGDRALREGAMRAISQIDFVNAEVEELLRDVLASDDEVERICAAAALLSLLPPEMELLEVLRRSHQSEHYWVRSLAAGLVTELIPRIPLAISVAVEFLDDWELATVEDTARSLAKCDPEIVIPLLLPMLKRESHDARFGVLWAIREFGKRAAGMRVQIINALIEALHFMLGDPVDRHAEIAAQTLLSFDEIPSNVRRDAEDALAFMEPPPGRFGFPPNVSQDELESLSAQELMPDPHAQLRKVRKMPKRS